MPFRSGFLPKRYTQSAQSRISHLATSPYCQLLHCIHFALMALIGVRVFSSTPFLVKILCLTANVLWFFTPYDPSPLLVGMVNPVNSSCDDPFIALYERLKILDVNILFSSTRKLNHWNVTGPDPFSHSPNGQAEPLRCVLERQQPGEHWI